MQSTWQGVEEVTKKAGGAAHVFSFARKVPLVKPLARLLRLQWLISVTDPADLMKAEDVVKNLQQQNPTDMPRQIARRIILEKSVIAGSVGLTTSLIPGQAIALLAIDFATITALQTEMVYQIAAAYGLDLKDPARKGELLTIFALSVGGSRALKAGSSVFKSMPLVGAAIGMGADATMLLTLGFAACRFYESKLKAAAEPVEIATT